MFALLAPTEVEGTVDVCIVGGGPAGLTAAVYVSRKKLSTAIITQDIGGQVAWTLGIENYMGYQYITGRELTAKFEEQVRQFPIPIVMDEVKKLEVGKDVFSIETKGGRTSPRPSSRIEETEGTGSPEREEVHRERIVVLRHMRRTALREHGCGRLRRWQLSRPGGNRNGTDSG
jgi:hypothetical protein